MYRTGKFDNARVGKLGVKLFVFLLLSAFLAQIVGAIFSLSILTKRLIEVALLSYFYFNVAFGYLRDIGVDKRELFGTRLCGLKLWEIIGIFIPLFMFSFFFTTTFSYLLSFVSPKAVELFSDLAKVTQGLYISETTFQPVVYHILMGIYVVIVAPIYEEIIFRGILLNRFAAKYGLNKAIILSSFIFGLLHFQYFLPLFLVGIFLSLISVKTSSLNAAIFIHVFNNLLAFGQRYAYVLTGRSFTISLDEITATGPYVTVLSLLLLLVVIFVFKRNWPSKELSVEQQKTYLNRSMP